MVHTGIGTLVCCGKDMILMSDEPKPEWQEKHIPVIEQEGNKVTVKVGSVPHPMLAPDTVAGTAEHYIERIEVITENKTYKKFLDPAADQPEAIFDIEEKIIAARAYCNIHGLWKTEI